MSKKIIAALAITADVMGTILSKEAIRLMASDLSGYGERDVVSAINQARKTHHGKLTLAAIIDRLPDRLNQPPGPEEAWKIACGSHLWNEDYTVVIQRAIFEAFPFDIWPDKIGGRMAFLEKYKRLVKKYGNDMTINLGWDPDNRESIITEAVERGLIPYNIAKAHIPHLPPLATKAITQKEA